MKLEVSSDVLPHPRERVWALLQDPSVLARLLPGVLMRNESLQFRCMPTHLVVDSHDSPFTRTIDAGRMLTAEVDGVARLEAVIEAAVRLAYAAAAQDDDIGVLVFADTVQRFVPPRRGARALRAVLDALAAAEGKLVEPDYAAVFRRLAVENRKRALVVLFTDVIDRGASRAFVTQAAGLRPRHLPVVPTHRP